MRSLQDPRTASFCCLVGGVCAGDGNQRHEEPRATWESTGGQLQILISFQTDCHRVRLCQACSAVLDLSHMLLVPAVADRGLRGSAELQCHKRCWPITPCHSDSSFARYRKDTTIYLAAALLVITGSDYSLCGTSVQPKYLTPARSPHRMMSAESTPSPLSN